MSREPRRSYGDPYRMPSDIVGEEDEGGLARGVGRSHGHTRRSGRYAPSPEIDVDSGYTGTPTRAVTATTSSPISHGHSSSYSHLPRHVRNTTGDDPRNHLVGMRSGFVAGEEEEQGEAEVSNAEDVLHLQEGEGDEAERPDDEEAPEPEEEEEEGEMEVVSLEALTARMKENLCVDVAGLGSGGTAAVWSVNSAKHNSGVACLLDWANTATYWQSDGPLPHIASVQFQKLTAVETVCVLLCYSEDESYTPKVISVKAGTHEGDMAEVASGSVVAPYGWVLLEVGGRPPQRGGRHSGSGDATVADESRVWCTRLEVVILENHENGRDCHVRGIRILGPSTAAAFTDTAFTQHLVLR